MGDGGPHHSHMELMGEGDIAGEQAASSDQGRVLDARHRMAEDAALVHTAAMPGRRSAAAASMPTIRPWATAARTTRIWS